MKTKAIGVALLVITLAGGTMGQANNAEKKQVQQGPAVTIPLSTGTAINASLVGSLDSEKSKSGDVVNAIVTEPVVYQRSVLIPKGSRIVGHVVRTGNDGEQSAALFVEFDSVVLKNGQTAQLNAGIQALAPVGAQATIPSREKYEEARFDGTLRMNSSIGTLDEGPREKAVVPSTYTMPRRTEVMPTLPSTAGIEGGFDRKGLFTPDSKGAFSEPNLRVFTPVSEGSHGTVIVGAKQNIHLENGTHLLIVVQPPAPSPDAH
jgi:Bacterial conjugation TrbI-like protein